MGSKGRIPPHLMRHPLPGPGVGHPDPFGAAVRPPLGRFPPVDMLPPPEIMEQKLASQHMEMERLATENQRLAATHGTLRQQLAAAQQELQMLESQFQGAKSERDQQMRALLDRMSKMEIELQSADRLKLDLQQAKSEAQSLVEVRQELISKVQQVTDELRRAHVDVQQIPLLMSELNHLRQEFHQCRATYEHERKVYGDHLESLQVMDKEYRRMGDEVTRLRAELTKTANIDKNSAYGGGAGYGKVDPSAYSASTPSSHENNYGTQQVHASYPGSSAASVPVAAGAGVVASSGATPTFAAAQPGAPNARAGYDAPMIPNYGAQRGPIYDSSRGPPYDPQSAQVHNNQWVSGYDPYRGVNYEMQRPPPYDPQRAGPYETLQTANYDPNFRGVAPPPPAQLPANNMPYGTAAAPSPAPAAAAARTGTENEAQAWGATASRR
ncbi:hypothetical protein KSS87_009175 [Heliosperma pusillum]|nr:hypothetical protein KSS87_009175 [Heliosperma pusillum]